VRPGASKAEIADAYRRYALRHHPDRGGDPRTFQAGVEAYRRLTGAAPRPTGGAQVVFHRRRRSRIPPSLAALLGRRRPPTRSLV
jgi:hypothetical protein